jgi:surface protein
MKRLLLSLAIILLASISAVAQEPYAVLSDNNTTLTFYYDGNKVSRGGMDVGPFTETAERWGGHAADITTVVFHSSFSSCTSLTSTGNWFSGCVNLTTITRLENLNTSNVTNMYKMFADCSSLKSLNVSGFDTSNVTDMDWMFAGCSSLKSLDLSNFDTSKLWNLAGLFHGCSSLTSLDVSSFNTSNVQLMPWMFFGCSSLTSLDLSNFDTSNVNDMGNMFDGCSSLKSLDVSHFDTSKATLMGDMFNGCSSLTSLDVSSFNTSNVTNMCGMFLDCSSLTSLDVSHFDTRKVTCMGNLFGGCSSLKTLDVSHFDTSNLTDMNWMFQGCSGLTTIDVSKFDTSKLTNFFGVFMNCSSLTSLDLSNFDISNCEEMYWAFANCHSLTSLDLYGFDTRTVKNMSGMFYGCNNLKSIYASEKWDMSNVENSGDMFGGCISIIGGAGTTYDENHIDGEYARIDKGSTNPGYLTYKAAQYKITYVVDGERYKTYKLWPGDAITPEPAPVREGYTFSGWSEIPATMPAHDVTVTGTFSINTYKLTYVIDGQTYKTFNVEYGAAITPEADPVKRGYTFSGWSEIPATMPAHDVTVTGTFTVNKYKLTYYVDGEEYKVYDVEYGASITPEPAPIKEGYTFSGWSEIPATMPAQDVNVTGTFSINTYKLTYLVDNKVYKTVSYKYGATIIPEAEPTEEGYTFSGWSEIPATMPAHDVTVTGTFIANKYVLTYIVDGEEYKSYNVDFGAAITPEPEPVKEGYEFSGWSEIPATMPAHNVIVTGSFTKGAYKLTYMVDGEVYKTIRYDYGAAITPEPAPTKEGYTFSGWSEIPATMPAYDVTVTGTFSVNKYMLLYILDGKEYKTIEVEYGATITPEPAPTKEGYVFSGWNGLPKTMPAHTVIVTGMFTKGVYTLTYLVNGEEYKSYQLEFEAAITPEPAIEREGHTFSGWSEIPATMPAHDVTVTSTLTVNKYILTYILDGIEYKTYEVEYGATITPEPAPKKEGYEFSGWSEIPETMPAHMVIVTGSLTPINTSIYNVMAARGEVRIYTPGGKTISRLQKGMNIVVMQDGTVKKIVVKDMR